MLATDPLHHISRQPFPHGESATARHPLAHQAAAPVRKNEMAHVDGRPGDHDETLVPEALATIARTQNLLAALLEDSLLGQCLP
jgi:hypothetical protein